MTLQDVFDVQKTYVRNLEKEFPLPLETIPAWSIVRALWPDIKELSEENGYRRFRIRMAPLANLLGAILCGDHNVEFHTAGGVLQTLTLIGMCSAVTSQFQPGYALAKIKPEVAFKGTVPVGAYIIMSAKKQSERGPVVIFELMAEVEGGQELFSTPRYLTMFKIPDAA
ncbi:MAG: hypothetical protein AAB618_03145 [Patescibacteria group bacterium]